MSWNNPVADAKRRVLAKAIAPLRCVAEFDNQHVVQLDAGEKRTEDRLLNFSVVAEEASDVAVVLAGPPQEYGKAHGVERLRRSIGAEAVRPRLVELTQKRESTERASGMIQESNAFTRVGQLIPHLRHQL